MTHPRSEAVKEFRDEREQSDAAIEKARGGR